MTSSYIAAHLLQILQMWCKRLQFTFVLVYFFLGEGLEGMGEAD